MSDYIMNVITEGYSDVMYLDTMAKNLGIENMKFIASIGASQSVHLAKILWGWGYPYKILFDSDKAGHDAKKSIMKYFGYQEGEVEGINFKSEHIVMISDVLTTEDKDVKTIESLIEEEDYKKFSNEFSEIKVQTDSNMKMIFAKTFADKVTAAEVTLCFETVNNFKRLFKKINE